MPAANPPPLAPRGFECVPPAMRLPPLKLSMPLGRYKLDKLSCEARELLGLPLSPSKLNRDVLTIHVTAFAQPFPECCKPGGHQGRGGRRKKTYPVDLGRLLGLGGERGR